MIAQPLTAFKLLRVLNHWIDNLQKHHNNHEKVNTEQKWYIKWKAIYPFIKSSKRDFLDVYRMITEDYSVTDTTANVLSLVEFFRTNYPEFINYYDIKPIQGRETDRNYFEFTLNLYYHSFTDRENQYGELASLNGSFRPFTSNNSITTWKTTHSITSSIASKSNADIPLVVHAETSLEDQEPSLIHDNKGISDDSTDKKEISDDSNGNKEISDDSNISFSQTDTPPPDGIKNTKRVMKNIRRTEDLKTSVSNICKDEIKREMTAVKKEFGDLTSQLSSTFATTLNEHTAKLEKLLSQQDAFTPIKNESNTVPSIYRKSMPSPKPTQYKPTFDFSTQSDTKPDSTQQGKFQRSGTFAFTYNDHTYVKLGLETQRDPTTKYHL
jgi:hypothetical protein